MKCHPSLLISSLIASSICYCVSGTTPESTDDELQRGRDFINGRLMAWRTFGEKQRWIKEAVEGEDGSSVVRNSSPSHFLSVATKVDGSVVVQLCNDRYSAVLVKTNGESKFQLHSLAEPYDIAFFNRRSFDNLSYLFDSGEYIPDLIQQGKVEVSKFFEDGDIAKVWFKFVDNSRASRIPSLPGDFELTFRDTIPMPIGQSSEMSGNRPQIHRIIKMDYETVLGEKLPVTSVYEIDSYSSDLKTTNTKRRPSGKLRYIVDDPLDKTQCYLEFYGLDEVKFAKVGSTSVWKIYRFLLLCLLAGGVAFICYRKYISSSNR
jgi:hypothetical protein